MVQYPTFGKIKDGGSRPVLFNHISVVNEDIFVKFGTLVDIFHTGVTVTEYPTFDKIQDGGFSTFGHMAVVNEDIFRVFCAQTDIGHTRVAVVQYLTFDKIKDGGGGHLEFSIFGHISS